MTRALTPIHDMLIEGPKVSPISSQGIGPTINDQETRTQVSTRTLVNAWNKAHFGTDDLV